MKVHAFAIVASGLDPDAEDFEDRFFAAGCDDATISVQKGLIVLEFAREAKSFSQAIVSAYADVREAGARVERFEPDPLVSLSEIATRTGLSRAAISLYANGERGRAFPAPIARVTSESPLWDWIEVARWMHESGKLNAEALLQARILHEANRAALEKSVTPKRFAEAIAKIAAPIAA
jgi:transcriptional regulator with XRE-family HTH domain